jgi:hypothetical protein
MKRRVLVAGGSALSAAALMRPRGVCAGTISDGVVKIGVLDDMPDLLLIDPAPGDRKPNIDFVLKISLHHLERGGTHLPAIAAGTTDLTGKQCSPFGIH